MAPRSLSVIVALWAMPMSPLALAAEEGAVGTTAHRFSVKTLNPDVAKVKMFNLGHFVGARAEAPSTVVLSFSASYCEPCKKELAELKALHPRLEKAGIKLAVIVIDTEPEGVEAMRKLTVDDLKLPFPVLSEPRNILSRKYQSDTLPLLVVVDKSGKIQLRQSGATPETMAQLIKTLGI